MWPTTTTVRAAATAGYPDSADSLVLWHGNGECVGSFIDQGVAAVDLSEAILAQPPMAPLVPGPMYEGNTDDSSALGTTAAWTYAARRDR